MISGGAGFIGYHLAKRLARENQVIICDNLSRGRKDTELKQLLENKNVDFVKIDLTEPNQYSKLDKNIDYCYQLAAINGTRYFYEMPETVLRVNSLISIHMLDWLKQSKCKKMLFSSSSETYASTMSAFGAEIPTPEDVPLCIDNVFNPRWSYAGSKILGELLFINYARAYDLNYSIVRYHNIYGERMGFEHVIPEFCTRIIKKAAPFNIFGEQETRAFCYVGDAVEATEKVMLSKKTNNQIINVGNSKEEIKIIDLAKKLFKIANYCPKLVIREAVGGSVKRRCPGTKKLKELTGFEAKIGLDKGLKRTLEWYKERRIE